MRHHLALPVPRGAPPRGRRTDQGDPLRRSPAQPRQGRAAGTDRGSRPGPSCVGLLAATGPNGRSAARRRRTTSPTPTPRPGCTTVVARRPGHRAAPRAGRPGLEPVPVAAALGRRDARRSPRPCTPRPIGAGEGFAMMGADAPDPEPVHRPRLPGPQPLRRPARLVVRGLPPRAAAAAAQRGPLRRPGGDPGPHVRVPRSSRRRAGRLRREERGHRRTRLARPRSMPSCKSGSTTTSPSPTAASPTSPPAHPRRRHHLALIGGTSERARSAGGEPERWRRWDQRRWRGDRRASPEDRRRPGHPARRPARLASVSSVPKYIDQLDGTPSGRNPVASITPASGRRRPAAEGGVAELGRVAHGEQVSHPNTSR